MGERSAALTEGNESRVQTTSPSSRRDRTTMATARADRARHRGLSSLPLPLDTAPMEAKLVDALPQEPGWQFEPKWDGFRCLAFRAGDEVDLRAKSGKPLARYFPEVVNFVRGLTPERFVIDGELAIPQG